jgi:glycosyltransferase involved in cell wall biosynthesis
MWSFTGHCTYSFDCNRWQVGCGRCPYPHRYKPIRRDATRWEWRFKKWTYRRSNLAIVAPSRWLADLAGQSILHHFPIHHIPNGIDVNIYRPVDSEMNRRQFGIPAGKKVLLFAAAKLQDQRKGSTTVYKALQILPDRLKNEIVLLTIGREGKKKSGLDGIQVIDLGYVRGDRLKAKVFSVPDLVLFPTRADNLPVVLQESMACGTPMVSFDIGGVAELVRPGITGFLARPGNVTDFCKGIVQLLEDNNLRKNMGRHCREIAVSEYALEKQAQRYMALYDRMLNASCSRLPDQSRYPEQKKPCTVLH